MADDRPNAQLAQLAIERDLLRDQLAEARAETAGLRAERDGLQSRLTATEADRDAWRALAQRSWRERWFGNR